MHWARVAGDRGAAGIIIIIVHGSHRPHSDHRKSLHRRIARRPAPSSGTRPPVRAARRLVHPHNRLSRDGRVPDDTLAGRVVAQRVVGTATR